MSTYADIREMVEGSTMVIETVSGYEDDGENKRRFFRRSIEWQIDRVADTYVLCHRDVKGNRLVTSFQYGAILCGEVRLA